MACTGLGGLSYPGSGYSSLQGGLLLQVLLLVLQVLDIAYPDASLARQQAGQLLQKLYAQGHAVRIIHMA